MQRALATPPGLFSQQAVEPGLEPKFSDCGKKEADVLVFCYQILCVPLDRVAQTCHPNSAKISFSEILVYRAGLSLVVRIQGPWVLDTAPALTGYLASGTPLPCSGPRFPYRSGGIPLSSSGLEFPWEAICSNRKVIGFQGWKVS